MLISDVNLLQTSQYLTQYYWMENIGFNAFSDANVGAYTVTSSIPSGTTDLSQAVSPAANSSVKIGFAPTEKISASLIAEVNALVSVAAVVSPKVGVNPTLSGISDHFESASLIGTSFDHIDCWTYF